MNPTKRIFAHVLLLGLFPACDLHIDVTDTGDDDGEGDSGSTTSADDADPSAGGESSTTAFPGDDADPSAGGESSTTAFPGDDADPSAGSGSTGDDGGANDAGVTSETSGAGSTLEIPGDDAAAACDVDITPHDVDNSLMCACDECTLVFANIGPDSIAPLLDSCECMCAAADCGGSQTGGEEGGEG
jgi:hypothetical protein